MFWGERKSKKFWAQILHDLDAKQVLDMTPGSGSCGRGCMELGINYSCVVRAPEHASWLQNVMDRHALQNICEEGQPLFEQDLATCIKEHFQDVLDTLNEADKMGDVNPEDEEEGDVKHE